jgi:hypothetical protein
MNAADGPFTDHLSPEDQAALDALVDAEFDLAAVPPPLNPAAARLAAVMGLLGSAPAQADDPARQAALAEGLVDATLARVRLADARAAQGDHAIEPALSDNDHDALEALISAGYDSDQVTHVLRRRARRHEDLLNLLNPAAAEWRGDGRLVTRTLDHVQSSIDSEQQRLALPMAEHAAPTGRRFRLADLVTVAALLLIGGAAVGPMVGAWREQARRLACQSGLQAAGIGFASYAGDFNDALPMASPSIAGNPWWVVGRPDQSNSANLFTLARTGYTGLPELACAGNADACRDREAAKSMDWGHLNEVSYSFQNLFGRERPTLGGMGTGTAGVLMVDASPVVRRAVKRLWINPLANSTNHGERGQNALMTDGRVQWLTSPVLKGGENIWLPHYIEQAIAKRPKPTQADPINGTETPQGSDDVFVGP